MKRKEATVSRKERRAAARLYRISLQKEAILNCKRWLGNRMIMKEDVSSKSFEEMMVFCGKWWDARASREPSRKTAILLAFNEFYPLAMSTFFFRIPEEAKPAVDEDLLLFLDFLGETYDSSSFEHIAEWCRSMWWTYMKKVRHVVQEAEKELVNVSA